MYDEGKHKGLGTVLIRDPIHGDIELNRLELQVIDTAEFQRLRHIKQLGTASLVYPGCTHTRFDHSLGVLAAACRILDALVDKGERISADDAQVVRLAALVHDVSHIPFGHTFEDERRVYPRHDTPRRLRHFLTKGELGRALAATGLADEVIETLVEPKDWRGQIVSGTLDADLLDYLRRDAYFAGLSQDYDDRIYRYFCIEDGQLAVDLTKKGLERHDARSEIVHLLRLRYFLTERVYFHHAKVIAGAMISKSLELATERGVVESDLYDKGDETLLDFLCERGGEGACRLIDGVRSRKLLKRAYVRTYDEVTPHEQTRLVRTYHPSIEARQGLEQAIADAVGAHADNIIVYCPPQSALKEARMLARLPDGVRPLNDWPERHLELDALEEQYARIWRFWVFAPEGLEEKVAEAAAEALGAPGSFGR